MTSLALLKKQCTGCGETKTVCQFRTRFRRGREVINSACRSCEASYTAKWREENPERLMAGRIAGAAKKYEKGKEWVKANPQKVAEKAKRYRLKHADKIRARVRGYQRRVRSERPEVALRNRISNYIRQCLVKSKRGRSWESLVGYGLDDLRAHMERQFLKGMGWHNMAEWHIDHIVPLSSFAITGPDDPELRRAWALSNLRPLWAKDNLRKGARMESIL